MISIARSFALRARGFETVSSSEALAAFLRTARARGAEPSHLSPPCGSDTIRPMCPAKNFLTILSVTD